MPPHFKQFNPNEAPKVRESMQKRTLLQEKSAQRTKRAKYYTEALDLLQTDQPGLLQPENNFEKTFHVRQAEIVSQVDLSTKTKASFNLDLSDTNLTPYTTAVYSRSGRALLVASRRGHLAVTDWRSAKLTCELHLNETLRDATFLHSDAFFATSQKHHAFIYDNSGAQVHVLRTHRDPGSLTFLPHHLLLASASTPAATQAELVYSDVSTGEVVARHDFSSRALALGACNALVHSRANGVAHMAHSSGTLSLWSPTSGRPLARVFLHAGGIRAVQVTPDGSAVVTTGADGTLAMTDLRTFKTSLRRKLPTIPTALAVSQRNLVAVAFGATVQVWSARRRRGELALMGADDSDAPYMTETFSGQAVTGLDFCPFEDVLGVCRSASVRSMLVPGAGEPAFDSAAPNPYDTRGTRREREVKTLLDKLPASSIMLDANAVGSLDVDLKARQRELQEIQRGATVERLTGKRERNRMKGRNKISKRLKRRQANIIDARHIENEERAREAQKTAALANNIRNEDRKEQDAGVRDRDIGSSSEVPAALKRFVSKT